MSEALNRVLRDARRDGATAEGRRVDWANLERRLFLLIEEEQRAERGSLAPERGRTWKAIAAGLAAAAALGVVVVKTREPRSLEPERARVADDAGNIIGIEGSGEVLVDGRPAVVGTTLRLGDVIEVRGAQVTVSRGGRLTLILERGSSAEVTHVQGALVLALAQGAVEAQVAPIVSGEALAVDVGRSRVAVHGTHLRVARTGEHVVVDLNEGAVSVGEAPRVGSTLGGLVTSPAHAEFMASDAQGTLRVTHDPLTVRGSASLGATAQPRPTLAAAPSTPASPKSEASESAPPAPPRGEPHAAAAASASGAGAQAADPTAQLIVGAAVRACMAERLHADDITVVVSTTLYLQLLDDGQVRSARFDPPVAPDVNACAAQSIYKTRFTHGGAVTIPVTVKN
jgi:ferric-dicitrate binding protein FerR (iron transport regulator)